MMANAKKQPPASLPSRPMENVHLPTPGSFGAGLAGMAGLAGLQGLAGLGAAAFGANPLIPQFPMAGLYGFGGNFSCSRLPFLLANLLYFSAIQFCYVTCRVRSYTIYM